MLGQSNGQSWSFLFIVILKSRKALEDPPGNHIATPLGTAAANLCNGFIRGEVRMYIARDRPVEPTEGEKRGQSTEHRVRKVSGEEVDLEGVPLPRSYLRHGTKLAA